MPSMPSTLAYFFTTRAMLRAVRRRPRWLTKNAGCGTFFSILSSRYALSASIALAPMGTSLSFMPLPITFTSASFRLTSCTSRPSSSLTLSPLE